MFLKLAVVFGFACFFATLIGASTSKEMRHEPLYVASAVMLALALSCAVVSLID